MALTWSYLKGYFLEVALLKYLFVFVCVQFRIKERKKYNFASA